MKRKKIPLTYSANGMSKKTLAATYSSVLLRTVPSAMRGLTSEFGMGSGISLSLLPPGKLVVVIERNSHIKNSA